MRISILLMVFWFFILASGCSDSDKKKTEFDCTRLCDKSLECQEIKESQLENCKDYCKKYQENSYFENAYLDAMGVCLAEDKCEDIKSCTKTIAEKCPAPPDVSKYAKTLCNKMIECKATTKTEDECIATLGVPDNYKCLTQKFIDDTEKCISQIKCETYLTDFLNCQQELWK